MFQSIDNWYLYWWNVSKYWY